MLQLPQLPEYKIDGKMKVLNQRDFKIIKPKISKGAQGSVDLAICKHGNIPRGDILISQFVIKRIKVARLLSQPKQQKYLMFELTTPYTLQHPGIINYVTHYIQDECICIVQEYATGRNLYDQIAIEGKFSQMEAARYSRLIIQALMYLHSHQIMHRDIKLENIMVNTKKKSIKLVDFGYSCKVQEYRVTCCGTRVYMSPQVRKKKSYTFSAEVWSMGVLMYEILAGVLNTDKFNPELGMFSFPMIFPSLAKAAILKMLNKNPDNRPSFPQVLKMPFFTQYNRVNNSIYIAQKNSIQDIDLSIDSRDSSEEEAKAVQMSAINEAKKERVSEAQKNLYVQAHQAAILKAKQELEKAQKKVAMINQRNQELDHEIIKLKGQLNVSKKRQEKLDAQYTASKESEQKLKKQNQNYQKKFNSMSEKLSKLPEIQEQLEDSNNENIKLKIALNVAVSQRDTERNSLNFKDQQLKLERVKVDELSKQLQKQEEKYYALQKTITGGAGLSTFDNMKQQATLFQTQEELQIKSRSSLQKYFQTRMHQLEADVGDVRKSISVLTIGERQYEIERESHIDMNQKKFKQLYAKLQNNKEIESLTIENTSLKEEVKRLKKSNAEYEKEEEENLQSITRLTQENGKKKLNEEEVKNLRERLHHADDELAEKENWMQIFRNQVEDLEFKLKQEQSRTTAIINEEYFFSDKGKGKKK